MTVYVDDLMDYGAMVSPSARVYGTVWCHMMADSEAELRDFALSIGCRPNWIQHAGTHRVHFDLTPSRRARALSAGAVALSVRELIKRSAAGPHQPDELAEVTT